MRRTAAHAGSWYSADPAQLKAQLSHWLASASSCGRASDASAARAIIAPHAGYAYSGEIAAWAYCHVDPSAVQRIFLLGPSHNLYSPRCLLSCCTEYETPGGSIPIDASVYEALAQTGEFDYMPKADDEREHSLEMHLPFIAQIMGSRHYTLVPIVVGALSEQAELRYGQLLAPHLADPQNLFVISSDFCHWGTRFRFTYHDPRHGGEIYESIEALDREGMRLIEAQDAAGYAAYQREFGNTICGRHPIAVLLRALNQCATPPNSIGHECKFVRYAQSSRSQKASDSSVSYASAVIWARADSSAPLMQSASARPGGGA